MGTALQPVTPSTPQSSTSSYSTKMAQQSEIRQNYHKECEALVNKQINIEFCASHVFNSMSCYFTRADQALPGFARFFRKFSTEERKHGAALMEYQAKRGGKVVLQDITKPSKVEWGTVLEAITAVLELEKTVTHSLQELETKAMDRKDFHLAAFIQRIHGEKVEIVKEIGHWITKIKRAGLGYGLCVLDRELEKAVINNALLELQTTGLNSKFEDFTDFMQEEFLEKQVDNFKEISDWLAKIRMA